MPKMPRASDCLSDPTASRTPAPPSRAGHQGPRRITTAWGLLRLVGIGLACALWPVTATVQELIVNQNTAQDHLTQNEARLFFTLRLQQWPNDGAVRVFVLPDDDPLHIAFTKKILGLFPYQLRSVWDRQVFSGTGQTPTKVANENEMLQRVATTPGAVGYLSSAPHDPRIRKLEVR